VRALRGGVGAQQQARRQRKHDRAPGPEAGDEADRDCSGRRRERGDGGRDAEDV
jgi:hypothetical protein